VPRVGEEMPEKKKKKSTNGVVQSKNKDKTPQTGKRKKSSTGKIPIGGQKEGDHQREIDRKERQQAMQGARQGTKETKKSNLALREGGVQEAPSNEPGLLNEKR